jgi:hypothetical protein
MKDTTPSDGRAGRPAVVPVAVLAVTLGLYGCARLATSLFGPPRVEAQEVYAENEAGPAFDHGDFTALLAEHVDEAGWVDYAALLDGAGRLDRYLDSLAEAPFDRLGRDDKLALLINAYNAFTLRLVLDHWNGGELRSIRDIPADRRWKDRRWQVGGHTWDLDQIEHQEIRPKFREPRVHFALVCAAVSCPPLRREAYEAGRLDEQLDDQTRYVHRHGSWFRFDEERGVVHLTSLYDWFRGDFEQAAGSVLEFAGRYSDELRKALDAGEKPETEWIDYDWSLNGLANAAAR